MNGTTFDALAAVGTLRDAGFGDRQAEAVAGVVRHAVDADRGALATKADIAALRADLDTGLASVRADTRADIAALENRLTTRFFGGLFGMGGVLVAVMAALKLFG